MIMKRELPNGRFIKNIPCPSCQDSGGVGHGVGVYYDAIRGYNGTCFRCGTYFKNLDDMSNEQEETTITLASAITVSAIQENTVVSNIHYRGLSKETCEKYGVRVSFSEETGEIDKVYFPRYVDGELQGYKIKDRNKKMSCIGGTKNAQMFGQNVCGEKGQMLVITEGEEDCLAAYQIFRDNNKSYRVCSLPDGANSKSIRRNFEWIDSFDTVVLAFDQDEVGKKCANEVAELFKPGKVKIMKFSEKDANKMLDEGKGREFYQSLFGAVEYRPDGIVCGSDTWERIKNRPATKSVPYPDHWEDMNKKTYGMRLGELDCWTSGSGMGKTQIIRELELHLFNQTEDNIGVVALEEPLEDSVEALMGLHMNKRIHLPDVRETITDDEFQEAWQATQGSGRFYFYDHFGSVDEDSLLTKIRFLAKGCGCKWIFLDHLSIVVSEFAAEGNERERIDTVMSKLKNLTQELGIWIGLIVHLRKTGGGKSFEEGAVPTLDDLRGSGSLKQLSNNVYALSRNQQDPSPVARNTGRLHVLKCRFTGRTGNSDLLYFNEATGRMIKGGEQSENGKSFQDELDEF